MWAGTLAPLSFLFFVLQMHLNEKRRTLRRLTMVFPVLAGLLGCKETPNASASSTETQLLERARERMKAAEEQDAKEVELLYSTKPIRVHIPGREYVIPVNYFYQKGKNEPNTFDATKNGFGFFCFSPITADTPKRTGGIPSIDA